MQSTIQAYHLHLKQHVLPALDDAQARSYGMVLVLLAMLDLEPARAVLEVGISPLGRRPRDRVAMLRCVLLMALLGQVRFNAWARRLKREPILAQMAGFMPGDAPGVGTLYDFMHRLLDGRPAPIPGWQRPSKRTQRRGRILRIRRLKNHTPGRAKYAAEQAIARLGQATNLGFAHRLNRILMRCAVQQSAAVGLLGRRLDVAVDSSMLISGAKRGGVKLPEITTLEGCVMERCVDPDAAFGWDSRVKKTVYGHRAHVAVARAGRFDLPLWLDVGAAGEPDAAHAAGLLTGLYRMLREEKIGARMTHVIADSGYDATALYRLVTRLNARPVIQLNPRNVAQVASDGIERDADGAPLCPGRVPMRLHQRHATKSTFGCPAKRRKRNGNVVFHAELCPQGADCMPESGQGPWVHLHHEHDPRMNPHVPRGSREEKRLFAARTAAERVFGNMKCFGKLDARPYRRRHFFHIVGLCHALALHAKAWFKAHFGERLMQTSAAVRACLSEVFAAAR